MYSLNIEFLIDNIFVVFSEPVFQQTVGIPMGTKLADLLVYSEFEDTKGEIRSNDVVHLYVN